MVSKHFLTAVVLCSTMLLFGPSANLFAGHGGGGGGHGGGGGGHGGYGGGYGGHGYGGYGYGGYGRGYGYGGYGYGGFYGGGLFYGDYLYGGGYPGYYAPYAYPNYTPSYYYSDPGAPYASSRISSYPTNMAPAVTAPASSKATIHVVLPDPNATVIFSGHKTTSTGTERVYHTPDLAPGTYQYQLRATWMQDGQQMTRDQIVSAVPGKTTDVIFSPSSDIAPAVSLGK
jgi:uncharacterized protein (TIGR03000 family)